MGVKITNNAAGTLSAAITSTDTTLTLTSGQGALFPTLGASDYCWCTLVNTANDVEVIKVTARSTDTLTMTRGQDNTTARAFAINDRLELRPTAALFAEFANPEGTVIKSTGETGGTKFLREDGDNTSSWQAVPAGGVDGIVSTADATAITINSSEQVGIGVTPTVPLQIRTALSSIGQTTPETVLMLETTAGSGDMAVGNGTRILFKISDDETNPSVGASIDAVRANGDDSISSTDLVFSTSQNDETLDEALRIDSSGNVRITGTLGNGNYRTNSANIAAAAKTITISNVQTLSPGNHWDSFGIEITVDGIDGGASNSLSKKWRHHCTGLSTWSLGSATEIWGGTPFTTAKTSSDTTDLVMTVTGAPGYSVIRVEVYSHSMNAGCNITFS